MLYKRIFFCYFVGIRFVIGFNKYLLKILYIIMILDKSGEEERVFEDMKN